MGLLNLIADVAKAAGKAVKSEMETNPNIQAHKEQMAKKAIESANKLKEFADKMAREAAETAARRNGNSIKPSEEEKYVILNNGQQQSDLSPAV